MVGNRVNVGMVGKIAVFPTFPTITTNIFSYNSYLFIFRSIKISSDNNV